MPDVKIVCDNCGSSFSLSYEEDEVSYSPSHCSFCGDFFDSTNEELDFDDDDGFEDQLKLDFDDDKYN